MPPVRARIRNHARLVGGAVALSFLFAFGATARGDIFTFTDADGTVHFTNNPNGDKRYRVYIRGNGWLRPDAAPGVVPVPPSDRDPARFTRYDEWIVQAATLYQIPGELVRAIIRCESDYDPRAVSVSGARGLMQLMPDTAALMQVRDIEDPRENIFGGVRFLRILANEFNGDLDLTVAAYNAGDGAIIRFGGIPPFTQTRDYVVHVTKFYRRYRTIPDVIEASIAD
jgi:soluble lytic murein transglycosylase-like protein